MNREARSRIVVVSQRVYQAMLVAYPRGFRQAYGSEMAQIFGTSCRQTLHERGRIGLVQLWLRTLVDLLATASGERSTALWSRESLLRGGLAIVAVIVACLAGYLHIQTDADRTRLVLIVSAAFLWGSVWPDRGRWRPLVIGVGIAGIVLIGYGSTLGGLLGRDLDVPSPLTSLPLLLGGYAGALLSWAVSRRKGQGPALQG